MSLQSMWARLKHRDRSVLELLFLCNNYSIFWLHNIYNEKFIFFSLCLDRGEGKERRGRWLENFRLYLDVWMEGKKRGIEGR